MIFVKVYVLYKVNQGSLSNVKIRFEKTAYDSSNYDKNLNK